MYTCFDCNKVKPESEFAHGHSFSHQPEDMCCKVCKQELLDDNTIQAFIIKHTAKTHEMFKENLRVLENIRQRLYYLDFC